ncbi:MAG: FtsQ-type POTRA domain-containing protein [Verrucomicrobia bacterium]|nr:FtsQ-type POTRA domain-containing protein [Verrucomicrobiota bacterium]
MKGRGRKWGVSSARGQQRWHALREETGKPSGVKSRTVKRRQVLLYLKRAFFGITSVVVVGAMALWIGSQLQQDGKAGGIVDSKPLAMIHFDSNGVLSEAWLGRLIRIPQGTRLMDVDIHGIKAKLEAVDQVASASVERELPDSLRIDLVEYEPILRLVTEAETGEKQLRLVSRSGVIFEGIDQDAAVVRALPYLGPYLHPDGGYQPLRGIEAVAQLLETCEAHYPEEHKSWKVVLLTNYSGEAELPGEVIELVSKTGKNTVRLIFSASLDYKLQLDRLQHIRAVALGLRDPLERVDLSLLDAAAVQFRSGRNKLL